MKKPLAENFWLMTALTVIPIFGSFAGYRYWMRMRAKKYFLSLPPEDLFVMLTGSEPPETKEFSEAEVEDMASRLAEQGAPFWHYNWVSTKDPKEIEEGEE